MLLRLKHQQSHASGNNLTIFSSSLRIENWQKVTISWNFCKLILSHEDVTKITIERLLYIKKGYQLLCSMCFCPKSFAYPCKMSVRRSHVQNGWWHIFFPSKRYFDDAECTLSVLIWSTIKICPFRIMPPTLAKAKRPPGKFPGSISRLFARIPSAKWL